MACPRFDALGNVIFSGKFGKSPLLFEDAAKRKSKNRDAGTLETKPILSITKDVYRSFLIEKVLPTIVGKKNRMYFYLPPSLSPQHTHVR